MRKFDTQVQELKYSVLKEVAKCQFDDSPLGAFLDIPSKIIPGPFPSIRCCIHKERAIVAERVKIALDPDKQPEHIVEVIDIACDECPVGGYEIGGDCRGCIAHRCEDVCPKDAIFFENQRAYIDKTLCVECGACAKVCPFNAILNRKRPCEVACKVGAITPGENFAAKIDYDKCIDCGACVYQCPFGAIMDHSFIAKAIKLLKQAVDDQSKVYAVVAPSISSQFRYATLGQVITGLKELGFHAVIEAALGADMVALKESAELKEKGFLTSSCCPAFVKYTQKFFPMLKGKISHNLSPMAEISRVIKHTAPQSKVIFIGPCTAKKAEAMLDSVSPYVDCVLTFEELQSMFDGRGVDITTLEESRLDNASSFGRIFARSGGLSDAVAQALKEQDIDFELKAVVCDGIEGCRTALLKASRNIGNENFIEGMACTQGCIGGAGCLTHGPKDKKEVDKYGAEAMEKTMSGAVAVIEGVYPGLAKHSAPPAENDSTV